MTQLLSVEPASATRPLMRTLLGEVVLCAVVFFAYGYLLRTLGFDTGLRTPAPPLYAWWRWPLLFRDYPLSMAYALAPVLLFIAWLRFLRLQSVRPLPNSLLLPLAVLFIFVFNLSVCLIGGPPPQKQNPPRHPKILYEIVRPFDYPGKEFTSDVPLVRGTRPFLHDFDAMHDRLALHVRTHPPGAVLFLYYVQRLLGGGLMTMALVAVAVSAMSAAPVFLIARQLYGQRVATVALGLLAVTPTVVNHGATSMDGVYALPLLVSVYLFFGAIAARPGRSLALAAGLGACLAVSAMMTFSTSCLGVLFGVYAGLAWFGSANWRRVWGVLIIAALTFAALYVALYYATGYHLIECLKLSMGSDSGQMGSRHSTLRRYLDISIANLAAFLIGCGFLITVLLGKQVRALLRHIRAGVRFDRLLAAFAVTIVLLSFSTLFRWETERIWLFMVPLAVYAAAQYIVSHARPRQGGRDDVFEFSLVALFVQTLAMQILMFTLW